MTRRPPGAEAATACAAADWCTRHTVPLALEHAGLTEPARFVRELPAVKDRSGAVQAHAALYGLVDRHRLVDPLRRVLVYAAIACAQASYNATADAQAAAESCAATALAHGVDDEQIRWVAAGGEADLVRSIWTLLELD